MLAPPVRRLWAAYAVSTFGTYVAFDAVPLLAILVLHTGAAAVALLAAAGPAAGALLALPLGAWVERRSKRHVLVGTDLLRCAAMLGLVAAFVTGRLALWQLLAVTVVVAACANAFKAASGAVLKELCPGDDLLRANVWWESTTWTAVVVGPPLGGAAVGVLGPIVTVGADAVSYLLSAAGLRSLPAGERNAPPRAAFSTAEVLAGCRHIRTSPELRPLFVNTALVNGAILASAPLMAVLMLGRLGFAPWEYGLAFGLPCVGGLLGSRLVRPLVAAFGRPRVLAAAGTARACWSLGLVLVRPGLAGLLLVLVVQFGLVTSVGIFNPLLATMRLERTPRHLVARVLSAWSIGSTLTAAALTAAGGLLAAVVGPRPTLAVLGVLLLPTSLLLRRRALGVPGPEPGTTDAYARPHRVSNSLRTVTGNEAGA